MLRWSCPRCSGEVFFNSFTCLACQCPLVFCPETPDFRELSDEEACQTRRDHGICNWRKKPGQVFCRPCSANLVIPDLTISGNFQKWSRLEAAKRRLFFSCHRLNIDTTGLSFQFLADTPTTRAVTGHCEGVITINIAEADTVVRERTRRELQEEFRTLIGHFRHELGHFFWLRQVAQYPDTLANFRELFGDERADYQASLQDYHASNTQESPADFITEYASSHPWEDWAESFAHYLHLRDVLETAREFGFSDLAFFEFRSGVEEWVRMTVAFNEINRSMGLPDLYPFALTDPVIHKLEFVHRLVSEAGA